MRDERKRYKYKKIEKCTIPLSVFLIFYFYNLEKKAYYNYKNNYGGNNYVSKILFTH